MSDAVAVSILIPAWDEEESVGAVVRDSLAACRDAGLIAECLVCVDARTVDGTARVARDAGARTILQRGRGLTAAVLQMAESAVARVCAVLDGDGQHEAAGLPRLVAPILSGEADLVTGVRDPTTLAGGFGCGLRGTARRAGAYLLRPAARVALGRTVPDPLTGMFACRRSDLLRLRQAARLAPTGGYKVGLALLATIPPGRVAHVTVPFLRRHGGVSKLGARVVLTTLRQLLGVLAARRPATPARTLRAGNTRQ